MKMLTLVCREQFEDEVLLVLSTLIITGYTVIHGVGGSGVALEDERMNVLVEAIQYLQARLVQE
ncbi:MAG TPA: hypothetical protein VF019_01705, partial [Nitrospira sp.]